MLIEKAVSFCSLRGYGILLTGGILGRKPEGL